MKKVHEYLEKLSLKQEIDRYHKEVVAFNTKTLFSVARIGLVLSGGLMILSFPGIEILHLFSAYLILTLFFGAFFLVGKYLQTSPYAYVSTGVFYVLMCSIMMAGMMMGSYMGLTTNATTFLLFLLILPSFLIDSPCRLILLNIVMTVLFIIMDISCGKPDELVRVDIGNVIAVCIISSLFVYVTVQRHIERFSAKAKDVAALEEKDRLINDIPIGFAIYEVRGEKTEQTFVNETFYELMRDTKEARLARTHGNFIESIHPDDRKALQSLIATVIQGKDYDTEICRSIRGDGSYLWVRFSVKVTQRKDNFLEVYATYVSMEEEMKSKADSKAKTAFLSRMSHEIRTPINAIMGMAELGRLELSSETPSTETIENYFDETTAASKYLLTLVNDVLDTGRIENHKLELRSTKLRVEDLLAESEAMIQPLADAKKIRIRKKRENCKGQWYLGDPVRIKQILVNIMNNAVKFTPVGGAIYLTTKVIERTEDTSTLEFIIKDTGIGMTEEFKKKLYTPFTQENANLTSPYEGTGLGLSIAKYLAEAMRGDITCESEPGKGTSFIVTVQLENCEHTGENETEIGQGEVTEIMDFEGMHILLIEDHPLNQRIARALLERRNCNVDVCENGLLGTQCFEKSPEGYYQLILMDIRMPVMDGLKATEVIRNMNRKDATTVPIIAMSANAFPEDVKKSKEAGMNDHLAKPVDAQRLYQTLGGICKSHE